MVSKKSGSGSQHHTGKENTSRGYSFDLGLDPQLSPEVEQTEKTDGDEYRLQKTTVLTGNHGKKARNRAVSEAD